MYDKYYERRYVPFKIIPSRVFINISTISSFEGTYEIGPKFEDMYLTSYLSSFVRTCLLAVPSKVPS